MIQQTKMAGAALLITFVTVLAGCSKPAAVLPKDSGSPLGVRLMSGSEYTETVANLFGQDIADAVPAPLPPMHRTGGLLASGAAGAGITADGVARIADASAAIASKVVDEQHREFLIQCKPAAVDAADGACAEQFLAQTARLWFRRPAAPALIASLVEQANTTATRVHDFYAGLGTALSAMLVSPRALYIIDGAEPDPARPGRKRLDAYSLAARLSFFLWGSAPDDMLLTAAEKGELATAKGRTAVVDTMLRSPRLQQGMRAFFDDMLSLNDFDSLSKDPLVYPAETGATLADAREQTLRVLIDQLVVKRADYRDLFTTRDTFMSLNLAPVYGVPAADGWTPYTFPADSPRVGILTQVSFLAAHAHPARSSVTRRGKALRELFLCQIVPAPPPNVDFSKLDNPDPNLRTARERLGAHSTHHSCAGCHKITDPIGLALEHFDGAGQFRATENGATIDTSGFLDGTKYPTAEGLAKAVHDHPALPGCLVNRVYAYGTGGPLSISADKPILRYFTDRFAGAGYRLPALLKDIALSDAFLDVRSQTGSRSK
ncbi:MAG: DUF1592 domain-containing protein [Proteobacteria bacterium]|nr:DUF1592 domain-containing protein [Pseudomonadota bacterium]